MKSYFSSSSINFLILVFGLAAFLYAEEPGVISKHWGFINETGTLVIKLRFWEVGKFSEGLASAKLRPDDKWGYIDTRGRFVIPPQFEAVTDFKEGLACVQVNHKIGYVDKTGRMVIPAIFIDGRSFSEGLAEVFINNTGKGSGLDKTIGFIDKSGKVIIKPKFLDIDPLVSQFSEGLAGVELKGPGGHCGYINKLGNVVINSGWPREPFSEGLAAVIHQDGKVGFIDHQGQFVIGPQFNSDWMSGGHHFSDGLSAVEIGNKLGFIDRSGKVVIEPQFVWATDFSEGRAIVQTDPEQDNFYIDRAGRRIFTAYRSCAGPFSEGLAPVALRRWFSKILVKMIGSFADVWLQFFEGKWGYINQDGAWVIRPQFAEAHSFSEHLGGVAVYKTDD